MTNVRTARNEDGGSETGGGACLEHLNVPNLADEPIASGLEFHTPRQPRPAGSASNAALQLSTAAAAAQE